MIRRGQRVWSQCYSQVSTIEGSTRHINPAIFGPREIYDSAFEKEKVLSIPYEQVLALSTLYPIGGASEVVPPNAAHEHTPTSVISANPTSDDLFIVSKIIRRSMTISDKSLSKQQQAIARQFCYLSAVEGNVPATHYWCEDTLRSVDSTASDRQKAMEMLTALAKQKNGKANYLLGNELYSLHKVKEAMKAYRLAGEQGVAEAFTKLGRILRHQGHHKQSVAAFRLAADAGEPNAQFMMSTFTKDENEQIQYLHKAAGAGKEEAAHNLGELYRRRGEVPLAKEYFELAATKGFQVSQANLASILIDEKDYRGAETWLKQAIRAGGDVASQAASELTKLQALPDYASRVGSGRSCIIM